MGTLLALFLSIRPIQWTKNLLVFLPLLTTLDRWWAGGVGKVAWALGQGVVAFALFCLLSSATYLVNDVQDAPRDRLHPRKRERPIPSGRLPVPLALGAAALLGVAGLLLSFLLSPLFGLVAALYLLLTLSYTFYLKRVPLVDVLAVSGGYLLRAVAGAVVLEVPISPWLYVVVGLAALLIALGKRRGELASALAVGDPPRQREALGGYSLPLLDHLLAVVGTAVLVSYALYTFSAPNLPENHSMMLTLPFALYALFRYLGLVYREGKGEVPEEVLFTDRPLLLTFLMWAGSVMGLLVAFGRGGT